MCDSYPKDFQKTTEVLPFTKYGLSSLDDFKKAEDDLAHQEFLKKAGLTNEEIKLYQEDKAGLLDNQKKIESGILKTKLDSIYSKIEALHDAKSDHESESSSSPEPENLLQNLPKPIALYPDGHPMNELKQLEENLFGHLKTDVLPITKRRKILRRLERKKQRLLNQGNDISPIDGNAVPSTSSLKAGSLWDLKHMPPPTKTTHTNETQKSNQMIGPKQKTMYTIKDSKIVRLEPNQEEEDDDEYRTVDIVVPVNSAEAQLLEGTKMCLDDIKKIERFRDYEPGTPSKVLYLKNIAPTVTQEQLSLLFNQFVLDNGAQVEVRCMFGRMRGQAFVAFQSEDVAIQALDEINGTILGGKPIIAEFGRNTNRILPDDLR